MALIETECPVCTKISGLSSAWTPPAQITTMLAMITNAQTIHMV
ncbi:MAG: hypothetical protein WAW22_12910 [Smithellaceae bacterium]